MALYRWVQENNDQRNPQHIVLLNDMLGAFLLAFEAAIQQGGDQYGTGRTPSFESWLGQQPEHDIVMRGLRTLRHLEAHVESYPVAGHITAVIGGNPAFVRRWSLQELTDADLGRLRSPKLKATDLTHWNELVESGNTLTIMGSGLDRLNELMNKLESLV